jgi:hypothetical protein
MNATLPTEAGVAGRRGRSLLPRSLRHRLEHARRARKELRQARACDVMVLSRAKSGRTWLRVLLSRLYQLEYGLPENELLEFDNLHTLHPAVPRVLFSHGTYLERELRSWRAAWRHSERRVLLLVRHPCDVAVSEYFQSTRRASQRRRELYGVDPDASMFDFVMGRELGLPGIVAYMNHWQRTLASLPHATVVRYEDLRAQPEGTLAEIARFLGAPSSSERVADAVSFGSFENLKELERSDFFASKRLSPRDPSDPDSFKVRRGKVGGYRDYFSPEELGRMEWIVRTQLDPKFGYGGMCRPERRTA